MSNYGVIIQARSSSNRFKNKVIYKINGIPMIVRQYLRLKNQLNLPIVVATSSAKSDDILVKILFRYNIPFYRGDLNNVVNRLIECSKKFKIQNLIRVGGDDPLIDPKCILSLIKTHKNKYYDFVYASHKNGWPYGCAAELINLKKLVDTSKEGLTLFEKEHTIPIFLNKKKSFLIKKLNSPKNIRNSKLLLSVDYKEDMIIIKSIFEYFDSMFIQPTIPEIFQYLKKNRNIYKLNRHLHSGFEG